MKSATPHSHEVSTASQIISSATANRGARLKSFRQTREPTANDVISARFSKSTPIKTTSTTDKGPVVQESLLKSSTTVTGSALIPPKTLPKFGQK